MNMRGAVKPLTMMMIMVVIIIGMRPMTVPAMFQFGGDQVQMAMPHTGLGDGRFGKLPDGRGAAPQENNLQAILMIEMNMQCRQHQIVMAVLRLGQATRQLPLMMIIDITETADRIFGITLFLAISLQTLTQQIADRLRTVLIAFATDEAVELVKKPIIQGNTDPFHHILLAGAPKRPCAAESGFSILLPAWGVDSRPAAE